jgi:2-polyprenyl-3-methyl-5-hydroxy-6-metoxy-1,4-benzoquinol methylase
MNAPTADPVGLEISKLRGDVYADHVRNGLLDGIDRPLGDVLDIGCARGAGADALRRHGAGRLVGVEIDEDYAAIARERYDEVVAGSAEAEFHWDAESFDTVLCYDVLEHTYDPWSILGQVHRVMKPGGRLQVSVPNSRNLNFWRPLVMKGTLDYAPSGLRDVTHIRFFTRRDLVKLIADSGFRPLTISPTGTFSRKQSVAMWATANRAIEYFAYQWVVLAERLPGAP